MAWLVQMLRLSWAEPLIIAHAERLDDGLDDPTTATAGCVVLDVSATERDWTAEVARLRAGAPNVAILVIGDDDEEGSALVALRSGAQDYLPRGQLGLATMRRALKYALERKQAEARLTRLALHDSTTELPNRALFLDRLGVALDRARRSGASVAVLFLDVDNFKEINDSRGHAAGDRMLVELAERLRTMLRPMDTVARFGGDEFTFLFEDLSDEREVVLIAERIARACKVPVELDHGEVTVSVSMGIAMVRDPRTPPEVVIREADAAMYRAKERGGGHFEMFDDTTRDRALERLEFEVALRRAIAERQLRVYYQPNFSLDESSGVVGLEALLRWEHPERGLIGAQEFIAMAEETGMVVELGQYVVGEVVRALAQWRQTSPTMTVAVNLSLRELQDLGLPATLAAALRGAGLEPGALCLEIAESSLARQPVAAARVLAALKDVGVQTGIDDFGTGTASLLALRQLPLDVIKIHGSLLTELNDGGAPVFGAVVELAHALGLRVIAEGVETDDQVEALRELGCDWAQGFGLAGPVPEADVEPLL